MDKFVTLFRKITKLNKNGKTKAFNLFLKVTNSLDLFTEPIM